MKTMLALWLAGLAGCTAMGTLPAGNGQTMREFALADAQQAVLIAQAGNDHQGEECFASLVAYLTAQKPPLDTQSVGVLGSMEKARLLRLEEDAGIPDAVLSACAPLNVGAGRALFKGVLFSLPLP